MSRRLGPAHVVLGIGANRLHDPSARASLIRDAAERGHDDVEVSECVDGAALRASVSAAADGGAELVVASGEDGTVHETAVVLADRGIPLGIIPAGTGNLLAGTLGIHADQAHALETIARGETRPIDIGEATWADCEGATATSGVEPARPTTHLSWVPSGSPRRLGPAYAALSALSRSKP